ncbi:hypothetical protein GB931_08470 [Modestobacter sp. I12A-02628]|nr:hypothetical protein [Goekera deserti]
MSMLVTQRLGLPLTAGSVSLSLPITYVAVVVLLVRRRLTVSRLRLELFVLAATACLAAVAWVSLDGVSYSMTSLLLLIAVYVPWTLRSTDGDTTGLVHAANVFLHSMLVLAAVGIVQLGSQLVGVWSYRDYLADVVPEDLFIPIYNTNIPLLFGSSSFKANAFVMIEPSFLSQFCALAVVIGLMTHVRAWKILVLCGGLASAVSGTGIVLLLAGVLLLLLRAPQRIRISHVVAAAVVVLITLLGPTAPLLLGRTGEVSQTNSSGNTRFVTPYTSAVERLESEPGLYLAGGGPGMSDGVAATPGQIGANFTIVPKLVLEYGLLAGGLFTLFLLFCLLDGVPWRVVPGTVVVMLFFLSGALLQPQTAFIAWILTGLGAHARPSWSGPRPARWRPRRRAAPIG